MQESFMKHALELARRGRYGCRPNPMVGALIVNGNNRIISEGWHKSFGGAHAEIEALRALPAGTDLSRCSLYVTLEPCSHHGKTPPCCEAIITRGIGRVVVGASDPNPLVSGRGIAALKAAGIEVVEGVLKNECVRLNRIFFKHIRSGRPWVTLKGAVTLDGRIAADSGHSLWVSGEESRCHAQKLRAWNMAIMTGAGTVLADNPRLTCRLDGMPSPLRVIADSHLRTPEDAALFEGSAPLLFACLKEGAQARGKAFARKGAEILICPEDKGRIDLPWLLDALGKRGIDSLLVEGGGVLHGSFLRSSLADSLALYLAPKILGSGVSFVAGEPTQSMDEAYSFIYETITPLGSDLFIEALKEQSCLQEL